MRGVSKAAEFAVAAGVGAAVLLGCGCAVASAEDSATGGTETASAQQGPRAETRPRLKSAERRREAAETRRVALDNRRAARAAKAAEAADAAEKTDDAPAPDVVAPLLPLGATPRRERVTDTDITDGPQTITTGPPSLVDRLILRTLQTLRHKDSAIFDGDGGNVTHTSPPRWVTGRLTITESEYAGMTVWSMTPKKPTGEYVLALHGGGFVAEANIINWADYAAMARQTGATVVVPIYPLAPPKGTASVDTLVPPMADYLAAMIDAHGAGNVSLYGDSAGGTYAMLVAQELVRRCRADVACVLSEEEPSRMVLISPVLHLTLSGPIVDDIDDPIIPPRLPPSAGGALNADDPRVNPIMVEDLTGLPPTAIYVGTVERPYPGDLMFRDKLLAQDPDADFTVVIGDGQMHDWALGGIFVNSQARLWRPTIYRQLGLV
ncbi:esterase [Mycolicibacterium chubuense]|uniref:Monoterpene epsilon-lactone hydrolase n=1 Tax=Mycolicibacterium chubuense TaxID=1800 RepID=A0A0J6WQF7_MYCCU|nr:Monoterpene epsilon-lactone hydrolase [Mycolicibacterium chubuense]ORA46266.1 esterase [Mycolicibacterium chubuense]SPY00462.1 esterase/lipase [Mycolicibacterium chubuense]